MLYIYKYARIIVYTLTTLLPSDFHLYSIFPMHFSIVCIMHLIAYNILAVFNADCDLSHHYLHIFLLLTYY